MLQATFATILLLTTAAIAEAAGGGDRVPGPKHEASPAGFNREADSGGRRANAADPIEGTVRETRVVNGVVYVSLSVGSDEGITRGMRLRVYGGRASQEVLGTVEVTAVDPEESIGRVKGPRAAEVREDDRVSSRERVASPPRTAAATGPSAG